MAITRRRFIQASGAAGLSLVNPVFAQETEVLFNTQKTELWFDVSKGRANPITISAGSPGYPPLELRPEYGNLVFYWLIKMQSSSDKVAQNIRLWLYQPKAGRNPAMDPPSYGLGSGHFLLRYPPGDNTFPRKEDTQLWKDYIGPNWELASGAHVTVGSSNYDAELAGTSWPGSRALAQYNHPDPGGDPAFWQAAGIPLRVAMQGIEREQLLLLLFELKRYGRLYLIARPVKVTPIIYHGICPFKASYGTRSEEVAILQQWRDQNLSRTRLGRVGITLYYHVIAPVWLLLIKRSALLKKLSRKLTLPLIRHIAKRMALAAPG